LFSVQYCNICPQASSLADSDSNMSSDAGSSHVSQASAGSHITRSVARRVSLLYDSEGEVRCSPRLAKLKEEARSSASSSTSFHFSQPTLVHDSARSEGGYSFSSPSRSQKLYLLMYKIFSPSIHYLLCGRPATVIGFYSASF
jgi:hypothetical protein